MKLRPVDFSLLAELKGGRNVASNLHRVIGASHQYVNERLAQLENYGLVDRVGPNPRSGLYEITEMGRLAEEHREKYKDESVDFDEFLAERIDNGTS